MLWFQCDEMEEVSSCRRMVDMVVKVVVLGVVVVAVLVRPGRKLFRVKRLLTMVREADQFCNMSPVQSDPLAVSKPSYLDFGFAPNLPGLQESRMARITKCDDVDEGGVFMCSRVLAYPCERVVKGFFPGLLC